MGLKSRREIKGVRSESASRTWNHDTRCKPTPNKTVERGTSVLPNEVRRYNAICPWEIGVKDMKFRNMTSPRSVVSASSKIRQGA